MPVLRVVAASAMLVVCAFGAIGQVGSPPESLHSASLTGDLAAVRSALRAGADVNEPDAFGSSPLTIAATFGHERVARVLLNAGADPEFRTADGSTALHIGAFFARERIVRDLLDHGADRTARNMFGSSAYDTVSGPMEDFEEAYGAYAEALGPLGLRLDLDAIREARPRIAELLRPTRERLDAVEYAPESGGGWSISTPEAEGLDPDLIAEAYVDAQGAAELRSLLVLRHGRLIAESYVHNARPEEVYNIASVTKSVTSALIGIALDRGELDSIDRPMLPFFPEVADRITDPRKRDITLRELLQMRGGYPWEESTPELWGGVLSGRYVPLIEAEALVNEPGEGFNYSNLSTAWLGMVLSRATGQELDSYASEVLFGPLGIVPGEWGRDADGNVNGFADLRLRPRDLARFGQCYLDRGAFDGEPIVPAEWVDESLTDYSPDAWITKDRSGRIGRYFRDLGYGYQWWSARIGDHDVDFAWGHGGQLIVLLHDLDMVVVATTNFVYLKHDDVEWAKELATFNVVGKLVQSLPAVD